MRLVTTDTSMSGRELTDNENCGRQEGYVHIYGTQRMSGRVSAWVQTRELPQTARRGAQSDVVVVLLDITLGILYPSYFNGRDALLFYLSTFQLWALYLLLNAQNGFLDLIVVHLGASKSSLVVHYFRNGSDLCSCSQRPDGRQINAAISWDRALLTGVIISNITTPMGRLSVRVTRTGPL